MWYISAFETLVVGAIAAAASFFIGMAFEGLTKEAGAVWKKIKYGEMKKAQFKRNTKTKFF